MKHCGNSTDLQKQTATTFVPGVSISAHLRDCGVVLGDISFSCGAAGLQMLDLSWDGTRMADSRHTAGSDFLKNLCLKSPIAWGSSIDERWTQLDDKVSIKLHMCTTLAEAVSHLQETIYTEAASIFGHLQQRMGHLDGQSRRAKLSIQLIHHRGLLLAQIKSSSLPDQQAALTHLLTNVECRIRSLR